MENNVLTQEQELKKFKDIMEIQRIYLENYLRLIIRNRNEANPNDKIAVSSVSSRTKSIQSIKDKFVKYQIEETVENLRNNIRDYNGHRIVCLTKEDVYKMVESLKNVEGLKIVEIKDYIKNPKESGYTAVHVIIENSSLNSADNKTTYSEIQIRTALADALSLFEHKLVYKSNPDETVKDDLKELTFMLITYIERSLKILKEEETKDRKEPTEITEENLPEDISLEEYKKIKNNEPIYKATELQLKSDIEKLKLQYNKKIISESSRIKGVYAIYKKLLKNEKEFTEENIHSSIRDIISHKIVCLTPGDAKELVRLIVDNDEKIFKVTKVKNYVDNPKESGYRGYNVNVLIDIPFPFGQKVTIPAEIKILTAFQNVWADYEEKIVYHNEICSEKAKKRLRVMSDMFNDIESQLEDLLKQNEKQEEAKKLIKK